MRKNRRYGNIYEVILQNNKFVYLCWIDKCNFGVFNYISEAPTDIKNLLALGFRAYKGCQEIAARKNIWKLIGQVDLELEGITWPDFAIYMSYDKDHFIQSSRIMRCGNTYRVDQDYYLNLLTRGYIYGFFESYKTFELWLSSFIEDYPSNYDIVW